MKRRNKKQIKTIIKFFDFLPGCLTLLILNKFMKRINDPKLDCIIDEYA